MALKSSAANRTEATRFTKPSSNKSALSLALPSWAAEAYVVQNVPLQLNGPTGSILQGLSMKGSLPCCWQLQEESAMLRHNVPDYLYWQLRPTGVMLFCAGEVMGQENVFATSLFRNLVLQLSEAVSSSGLYPGLCCILEEVPHLAQGRPGRKNLNRILRVKPV